MAHSYIVQVHAKFQGAIVKVIKRMGCSKHTHDVLVETTQPHPKLPKGERFEIDMRDLTLDRDTTKWLNPYEMKNLNLKPKKEP